MLGQRVNHIDSTQLQRSCVYREAFWEHATEISGHMDLLLNLEQKTSDVGLDQLLKEVEQEIDAHERAQATQPNPSQPARKPCEQPHTVATLLSGITTRTASA